MFLKKPFWKEVTLIIREKDILILTGSQTQEDKLKRSNLCDCKTSTEITQKSSPLLQNKEAIKITQNKQPTTPVSSVST